MEHDYRHLSTEFDMDAWLDAADELATGNHSANDVPRTRPFVHMVGPGGDILLRQWPESATTERLSAYARVLTAAHGTAGDAVPLPVTSRTTGEPFVEIKERLYSGQHWLPGRALGRFGGSRTPDGDAISVPLPESAHAIPVIAQAAAILAQAHAGSENVDRTGLPEQTLGELTERVNRFWATQRRVLGDKAATERDIRRWLRCGHRMVPAATELIRNEPEQMHDTSVVLHGDLWPENVLIEGLEGDRAVTGLVGFWHMASGSPVMDLAQMSVYMQGWSAALTEAIIESYSANRHLQPHQRRLIPAVAGLMLVERVGIMLTLNYLDQRMIGHDATPILRSGMKTLLDSLERITHMLAPDIERTQRGGGDPRPGGYRPRRDDRPTRQGPARNRPTRRDRSS